MAKEYPETASGYQGTMGLLVLLSTSCITGLFSLYILYLRGDVPWTKAPFIQPSVDGVKSTLGLFIPLFTSILVTFSLMTKLPLILSDPEKRKSFKESLWNGVIPTGTAVFFALLFFRFLGGAGNQSIMQFILVVAGVIGVGVFFKLLIPS